MPASTENTSALNRRITRNMAFLALMLLLAAMYVGWLSFLGALTGSNRLDGSLGILLGLYICSHPAANMLDMLLFMSADTREGLLSIPASWLWLFLNLLTALAAWVVIFNGVLRFVSRSSF